MTKLGKSTMTKRDTVDTSKQAFKAALLFTTQTIKSPMKFDLAPQHIIDFVTKLRPEHSF